MTAAQNDVVHCMELCECAENKHRWLSTAMLERNGKRLDMTKVRTLVDVSARSVNYSKAQHNRKCGKVKRTKEIREDLLQELKNTTKEMSASDVMVVRHFDEDTNAKKHAIARD